jgi:UDP-N-acetylglucosamine--N-acetylmuramyl-(pentapeptide) pyrophosphoryl-undecaprenol N-acetylglucosamine transferase
MKVLITGGGTGGHIYPALAIAERLKKDFRPLELMYVGSKTGMEKDLVPKKGITYVPIDVAPLNKKFTKKTFRSIGLLFKGLWQANGIIKRFKPDIIIGTGGYVAGSLVLIGALRGIPTAIHEQNAYPGLTNRILSRFVDCIMVSFEDSKAHFKHRERTVYTGMPIMDTYFTTSREQSRQKLGVLPGEMLVVTVGGSNGAMKLNHIMLSSYNQFSEYRNIKFIHVSGTRYYPYVLEDIENKLYTVGDNVKIIGYLKDMPTYLFAADLVVSRAGASTINEIIASKAPSVIIPSPNVANDHQLLNAQLMDKYGMGVVMKEEDLNEELMAHTIMDFYKDPSKLNIMRQNCEKMDLSKTLDAISAVVKRLTEYDN